MSEVRVVNADGKTLFTVPLQTVVEQLPGEQFETFIGLVTTEIRNVERDFREWSRWTARSDVKKE